jgi:parvulin-like peptidyl-prolyl isomerase
MGLTRWLREPLLHFAVIGIVLFAVYGWMNPAENSGERIVVTQAIVDDLARQHQARWMRPASEQELANLVEAHVRDEILFREGVALGLDRDDPVIKRRVRQKLDLMSEEQIAGAAPTDADLAAYMAQNPTRFLRPATVSFEQILLDGARPVADVERQATVAKAALARGVDPGRLGKPTLLPRGGDAVAVDLVARDFGRGFAEQLTLLPLGEWTGPVASGLGPHLVRVSARTPAAGPPLDDVRQQVAREWENERRERSRTESYRKLRDSYTVVIEPKLPQATAQR